MIQKTTPENGASSVPLDKIVIPMGMTVKELKKAIINWPETNEYTGEDCEVWLTTGVNLSSPVVGITPLNKRKDDNGNISADILFETNAFN